MGENRLVCDECGATTMDGRRWKAEVAPDLEDVDEVVTFCPECWEREFGDA